MDVDAERVLLQPVGVGRRLHHDGEDGAPAFGGGQRVIDVAPLGPSDAEAVGGSADDAGDLDGNLCFADLREGIAGARVIVQRQRALVGDVVVGG